jgi:hypothetical protein
MNRLKHAEEESGEAKEGGSTSDLHGADSAGSGVALAGTGRTAVALGVALGCVGARRVALLTTASVGTLDGSAALEALECGASIIDVLGRDESEGTTNVVESREVGTASCQ